ncbi:polysaccharide deacetylase family protein [Clostridium saccharoperbutylacetonicum]|uniref:polysaccharide deacetylase family protein n=1 Tax=Clostridium saccharoperbutylacetonicum TaxID=36745 RepID=UPI000983C7C8|nr:polysaccharide deacetylase family protein [Clostridium saccharoperbutylacetonicum]AQR96372.1 peptidoglycan-N-acetylglucosamine deacetylase [Clostridium saccharoperbutylacetonicum]NSB32245.1 peptidoglycan/xylan/chitin deacetylase (PgdA/CDA1 family) [Clostridium saccharoperbutylacetonicum]
MRLNHSNNKDKRKDAKKMKRVILFVSVILVLILVSGFAAHKFSLNVKTVQAIDSAQNKDSKENTQDKEETNSSVDKESDTNVENAAYLEKYIEQQVKGQKPTGADGKKVAYLTFDDGPSETVTPQILDILKSENVNATFFLIGKYVDKNDESKNLVKREIAEGNSIGIHSYSHDYNYLFPNGKINLENCMSDFEKTDKTLKNVLGQDFSTRAIRFPGGQITWAKKDPQGADAVDKALHEKDWHQIDWNALSGDAEAGHKNSAALTEEAIKTIGSREKAVILMHDTYGKEETAKALPGIIEYLKKQGYEFKIIK